MRRFRYPRATAPLTHRDPAKPEAGLPKVATADVSGRDNKLTEEILETQKCRSDLLKWKFLVVAALGAAGLGLSKEFPATMLLLALVPFACIYVDLLCGSLKLRLLVIGAYYSSYHKSSYEGFVGKARQMFDLEDWALYGSTSSISVVVAVVGIYGGISGYSSVPKPENATSLTERWERKSAKRQAFQSSIVGVAGLLGIFITRIAKLAAKKRPALLQTQVPLGQVYCNNPEIENLQRPQYSAAELESLRQLLINKGAFSFATLPNGLFPAAGSAGAGHYSGYQNVWVRDNVHVAHAQYACGDVPTAVRNAKTLMEFFKSQEQQKRFQKAIVAERAPHDPMDRPHIRFKGDLTLLNEKWSHAQNDALGYFLWFYCKLAREGLIAIGEAELECLRLFPRYFDAIKFWEDEDSGHWEEPRKINASSIGTVLAGLKEFQALGREMPRQERGFLDGPQDCETAGGRLNDLIETGTNAFRKILPHECIKPEHRYRRRDGALLFLIYPLGFIEADSPDADNILQDVTGHLQGEHGIRRYIGDSYWCGDYDTAIPEGKRSADYSESTEERDKYLKPGEEAQWCIFDPIISVIHGLRCLRWEKDEQKARESSRLQTYYLNRSLGHLTRPNGIPAAFRAPEAYYLSNGTYIPNPQTPLLWTQANLLLAMEKMRQQLKANKCGK